MQFLCRIAAAAVTATTAKTAAPVPPAGEQAHQ